VTKTKPPAPVVALNGNGLTKTLYASSTVSMQINAGASSNHAKDKLSSLFFYFFLAKIRFLDTQTTKGVKSEDVLAFT
jgi:hypothetical protein